VGPLQVRGGYSAGASEDSTEQWLVGVYRPGVSGCLHSRGNCGLYRAGVSGVSTEPERGDDWGISVELDEWGVYKAWVSGAGVRGF
jgi:hypothetical protein